MKHTGLMPAIPNRRIYVVAQRFSVFKVSNNACTVIVKRDFSRLDFLCKLYNAFVKYIEYRIPKLPIV
jgi:hypothetical protein